MIEYSTGGVLRCRVHTCMWGVMGLMRAYGRGMMRSMRARGRGIMRSLGMGRRGGAPSLRASRTAIAILICILACALPACNRDVYDNLFDPVNQYTVTFDSQGGTAVSAQTVDYGSTISQPADPVLTGYTFAGWFTEPGCTSPWLFGSGKVEGDATLYARWTINQYTVSFDPQGGSAIAMQTVNYNGYAADPGAPARTGYTFGGWFREAGCVTQWVFAVDTVTENWTLFAQWTINTYTLTYTAGANGSLTGTTTQFVTHGANGTAVTAVPNAGYHFNSWSDGVLSATRTDTGVTGAITVTANFAINQYTLSYSAGANGSLSGSTAQVVNHGSDGTAVTATPNVGYHFVDWSDGSTANPHTDTNVTGNITVSANFAINQYTLTYTAGANGSISGTTPQSVNHGSSGTAVTAVPNVGYHFASWSDGVVTATRTDTNVTGAISVTANFTINQYTLSYSAGANGSLSGSTAQVVNHGASGTAVTAVPNVGYHFTSWNDGVLTATRTDTNVTSTITVSANFAINTYTLTYFAGANGSITGTTPQTVDHGASGTAVTAMPSFGYHFTTWDDGVLTAARTDTTVTGPISVTASFAINTYTLTYNAGAGGSITGSNPQTVNHGANGTAVTATPNANYHFTSWSDGGLIATRTDTNVTGDMTVAANFAIDQHTVAFDVLGGAPAPGPQTLDYGSFVAEPTEPTKANYFFRGWFKEILCINEWIFATDMVTGDITLYAKWLIPFITIWKTDNTGNVVSGPNQVKLPLASTGTYDFIVDWGDGTSNTITTYNQPEATHSYAAPGTYTVTLAGQIEGFGFAASGQDSSKLIDIARWGSVRLHNNGSQFRNCNNLTAFSAIDSPDLSSVSNMSSMFYGASSFNGNISAWNVANATNMSEMFRGASAFNQNLNTWNVANVTNMNNMFRQASSFNGNISSWNVANVTEFTGMFWQASSFNQDISSWNVSNATFMGYMFYWASSFNANISAWNVTNVIYTGGMFWGAVAFNQNISGWNVANVTIMQSMFRFASSFNQNISGWNVAKVNSMLGMFENATAFNQNLSGWCVTLIASEPFAFDDGAASWSFPRPVWGTCP